MRWWAFWRRLEYATGVFLFFCLIGTGVYYAYFYKAPTCFNGFMDGDERGLDCGGACVRICPFDVLEPKVLWSESFRVTQGQYNAVAYIENKNIAVGSPSVEYTFRLYDERGLITERSGVTILPPDSVYPIFEGRITTDTRVPTRTELELRPISLWLPSLSGRERFVVENRQLKNVDSRPRLDARLTNTSLVGARKVEIVAVIFDSKGNPLTASETFVPRFEERATEPVVFTWPEPIAKTIRSCEVPTDVILAIDLSGSMNDDGGTPPEPVTSVLRAAESFVKRLKNDDGIGIVTYATQAALRNGLTHNKEAAAQLVRSLAIAPADEVGSTNTGDALRIGTTEFASPRHSADARKVLILLTDGLANAPGEEPEQYALDAAKALKEAGVEVFTIGLGSKVNTAFLESIASDRTHYYLAPTVGTISRIYESITEAICEDGPAVIEIVPKTIASFPDPSTYAAP